MSDHHLDLTTHSVHGVFSRELPPAVEIDSGDTVVARTADVTWGLEQHGAPGSARRRFEPRDPVRDDGPALVGPIAVRGAKPGDVLAVEIASLRVAEWGWTFAGGGPFNRDLNDAVRVSNDESVVVRWTLDAAGGIGTSELGHRVKLAPFLGIVGLAPGEPGIHSGWTPRATGGNMDCRALVAGTTVFLPIAAPGALLSIGDGHARQGDGESSGTAIECPMERVELRLTLRDDLHLTGPRAVTPSERVTLGFGDTLEDATHAALNAMLDWLAQDLSLSRAQALALASVVVDLRVTQLVNGVVGVHAALAHDALEE